MVQHISVQATTTSWNQQSQNCTFLQPRGISNLPICKPRALQSAALHFCITTAIPTQHSLCLGGIIHALHIHRQWLRTQAHSNHANSWNHQIIARMLITCHEEFITTLLDRGSTRSKLPQLELIQLSPNCAFDKALSEQCTWSIYEMEWIYRIVFLQPQNKVQS